MDIPFRSSHAPGEGIDRKLRIMVEPDQCAMLADYDLRS
jgi:hypothetical protein